MRLVGLASEHALGTCADLGSGTGLWAEYCSGTHTPFELICGDLSVPALRVLQSRRPGVRGTVCLDLCDPPFKPGSFDSVVLASVIQWLETPEIALREARELLRENGIFFFSAFAEGTLREVDAVKSHLGLNRTVRYYTPRRLETLFRLGGFDVICRQRLARKYHYQDAWAALRSVHRVGASVADGPVLSPQTMRRFHDAYENRFREQQGVPVSWEVVLVVARKIQPQPRRVQGTIKPEFAA